MNPTIIALPCGTQLTLDEFRYMHTLNARIVSQRPVLNTNSELEESGISRTNITNHVNIPTNTNNNGTRNVPNQHTGTQQAPWVEQSGSVLHREEARLPFDEPRRILPSTPRPYRHARPIPQGQRRNETIHQAPNVQVEDSSSVDEGGSDENEQRCMICMEVPTESSCHPVGCSSSHIMCYPLCAKLLNNQAFNRGEVPKCPMCRHEYVEMNVDGRDMLAFDDDGCPSCWGTYCRIIVNPNSKFYHSNKIGHRGRHRKRPIQS